MATPAAGSPDSRATFYRDHLWFPLAATLPMLLVMEATDVDRIVSNWFFDSAAGRFPLRYNALFEVVTHQWAKYVVVLIACAAIAAWLMSFVLPALKDRRPVLLFLCLGLTLAPATVSALKAMSPAAEP